MATSNIKRTTPYGSIAAGDDLNNYHTTGIFIINVSGTQVENCPSGYSALVVVGLYATSAAHQLLFNSNGIWVRSYTGNPMDWTSWKKVGG